MNLKCLQMEMGLVLFGMAWNLSLGCTETVCLLRPMKTLSVYAALCSLRFLLRT